MGHGVSGYGVSECHAGWDREYQGGVGGPCQGVSGRAGQDVSAQGVFVLDGWATSGYSRRSF